MTKAKCQMTKEARMTKAEIGLGTKVGFLGIEASSFFRHLAFVIRH